MAEPRRVIEARIGRDALVAEAIEHEAVPEFYARAIEEHGVQPLTRAQVDTPDWQEGAPLEFTATVEVKPTLELPPYEGVQVERPAAAAALRLRGGLPGAGAGRLPRVQPRPGEAPVPPVLHHRGVLHLRAHRPRADDRARHALR